jgi:hypothetical protein
MKGFRGQKGACPKPPVLLSDAPVTNQLTGIVAVAAAIIIWFQEGLNELVDAFV